MSFREGARPCLPLSSTVIGLRQKGGFHLDTADLNVILGREEEDQNKRLRQRCKNVGGKKANVQLNSDLKRPFRPKQSRQRIASLTSTRC